MPKSQRRSLILSNVSVLQLTANMVTSEPFSFVNENGKLSKELSLPINTGEYKELTLDFDPSFKKDLHNQIVDGFININYLEHQHTVNKKKEK